MDLFDHDFLIALTCSMSPQVDGQAYLLELNWCAYNVKQKSVDHEYYTPVRPPAEMLSALFPAATETTGLRQSDVENAEDFPSVYQRFNKFVYEQIILSNSSFCLVTVGDDLIRRFLVSECQRHGLKLAHHFLKYFDVRTEFERCYPGAKVNNSLSAMLRRKSHIDLRVKENPEQIQAHQELKSTIRILNKILKDGFKLQVPKDLSSEPAGTEKSVKSPAKKRPPAEAPPKVEIRQSLRVVYLLHAPHDLVEGEVEEFFYSHRVDKVVHLKTPQGSDSGAYLVKFALEEEALESLLYTGRKIHGRGVEVLPSSELAMEYAVRTNAAVQTPAKAPLTYFKTSRLENLPNIVARAIYIYRANEILVVAEEGTCGPLADLYPCEEADVNKFLLTPKPFKQKNLTTEQRSRAMRIRGLSTSSKVDILKFLRDFFVRKEDIAFTADSLNKSAVEVVVVLMTPEERNRAVATLHNTTFESKLVEVYSLS